MTEGSRVGRIIDRITDTVTDLTPRTPLRESLNRAVDQVTDYLDNTERVNAGLIFLLGAGCWGAAVADDFLPIGGGSRFSEAVTTVVPSVASLVASVGLIKYLKFKGL